MKNSYYCCILLVMLICGAFTPKPEWIPLFNGKDIKNWNVKIHHHNYKGEFAFLAHEFNGKIYLTQ